MKKVSLFLAFAVLLLFSCNLDTSADLIVKNAVIYAVDTTYSGDAIAIKDGKIMEVGTWEALQKYTKDNTEIVDAKGHFVMPGFIEGHGHFYGIGRSIINLNFLNSRSWESIVDDVAKKVSETPEGAWIIGRGWHQEKWDSVPFQNIYKYPFHHSLSEISSNNPVVLYHASGHALYANQKAMEAVGINRETPNPVGGEIIRDAHGDAMGVFEERAMDVFSNKYEEYLASLDQKVVDSLWYKAIILAEDECLKKGVTSFQDAGVGFENLSKYEKLAADGKLRVRLWSMMLSSYEEMKEKAASFIKKDLGNGFYTCNAIKSLSDGALGSYGAWLLEPYTDKPGFTGQNTTDLTEIRQIAELAIDKGMQYCVHSIGDRANREVLDIFEKVMLEHPEKTNLRWRMEHAQHLSLQDIPRFKQLGVIASMQGVHCTSDSPFVIQRLGETRAKDGAYAWQSLLKSGAVVSAGTDAPVEDVDPFRNFYAMVTRKREDSDKSFFPEQAMTRHEALYAYTMANAYAAFQEKDKGSIRSGKYADLVILSNDLTTCSEQDILSTKVLYTIVDGKIVYKDE